MQTIIGNLQTNFIILESQRSLWIGGVSSFTSLSFTQKVSRLTTVFGYFFAVAYYIDQLYEDQLFGTIVTKLVSKFDSSFAELL